MSHPTARNIACHTCRARPALIADENERRTCSRERLALPAPFLPDRVWPMAVVRARRTTKSEDALSSLVQEVRALDSTQLLTLSMVTPKADSGFMLITPDLQKRTGSRSGLSFARRRRPHAGLQLFVADRGKRIHDDAKRNTRERCRRTKTQAGIGRSSTQAMNAFRERMKNIGTNASIRHCPTGRWFVFIT